LTEPGKVFLVEARRVMTQAAHAKSAVQQAARGEIGSIRVGLSGSTTFNPVIPEIVRAFRDAYPAIDLKLDETSSASLIKRIVDDDLDVAFVLQPLDRTERLVFRQILSDTLVLALPSSHRFASSQSVALAALAAENLILVPREVGPGYYDLVIAACQQAGFSPQLGQTSQRMSSAIHFVAAGLGIAIVPAWLERMVTEGVVYRPIIEPLPRVSIELVHPRAPASVVVNNFLAIARPASRA
jgi:DNA-binding transcriptional LysR family regulator